MLNYLDVTGGSATFGKIRSHGQDRTTYDQETWIRRLSKGRQAHSVGAHPLYRSLNEGC